MALDCTDPEPKAFPPRRRRRMKRPLPWPASRISDETLYSLWLMKETGGRSIARLVEEAVVCYLASPPANPMDAVVTERSA